MKNLRKLISVMKEVRALLAHKDNDFVWSAWENQNHALSEIDSIIMKLEKGSVPDMGILFAPTGPIQEVSLSSGWGKEFLELAHRFDREYADVKNKS
jgi:hypothetical protein